jgi:hypothetical protein
MADVINPLSSPTAHYGWAKPTVGGDLDVWGGMLNADLDGIDTTVFTLSGSIPLPSDNPPVMDGTAAGGTSALYARYNHVHPSDTSRASKDSPTFTGIVTIPAGASIAGYATTSSVALTYLPLTGGSLSGGLSIAGPADLKAQTVTQSGASLAISRTLGENCTLSLTASITAVTVTGWPASGTTGKVRLIVANTGAFTIAGWPSGTIWPGGTVPAITSGAGKKDIILLMSDDAGATIYGSVVGQDYH